MTPTPANPPASHFLRSLIERDLAAGSARAIQSIVTRFPPEPNGYLHIGHAKAIVINFGLAARYGGRCHMRFDDTNPEKESSEYVATILDTVRWLGYDWQQQGQAHLYYTSDYFATMFDMACALIRAGHAYVDSQSADEIRQNRGTLTSAGIASPYRERSADESLALFMAMRDGAHADGTQVLRARIDMAAPNINLRDPVLYRVRRAHHHRTGDQWCLYPMYDYSHPIADALEGITHSFCTLEFEAHRPLYDWLLQRLRELDYLSPQLPVQTEFARLNLSYTLTSKRKLLQLIEEGIVSGWDDPRLPTLVGLRRRGYTASAIRLFCERAGVSKADSWIDYASLEIALRDTLEQVAERTVAVIEPLQLVIDNFPPELVEPCQAPRHPQDAARGIRQFGLTHKLWIERSDFQAVPSAGFFRLSPGTRVRLRYGFVIECTHAEFDAAGQPVVVHCQYFADSKSGTSGSNQYKVKGNIHWLSQAEAVPAEFRLYERLFQDENPERAIAEVGLHAALNPNALRIVHGFVSPDAAVIEPLSHRQFERQGYFVSDATDHRATAPVFNLAVALKNS